MGLPYSRCVAFPPKSTHMYFVHAFPSKTTSKSTTHVSQPSTIIYTKYTVDKANMVAYIHEGVVRERQSETT